jgi:hypothetical protein
MNGRIILMDNFVFGIENYCEIKYIGPDDHAWNYNWFSNKTIPLKNGFGLYDVLNSYQEIPSPDGYDIYYEVTYNGETKFFSQMDARGYSFNKYSLMPFFRPVSELIQEDKNFIFIIDCGDYVTIDRIELSDLILDLVKRGKCKIGLNTSYEPYSIEKVDFVEYLDNFVKKYDLNNSELKIITGNLKVENDPNWKYEFVPYCYFFEHPWFIMKDAFSCDDFHDERNKQLYEEFELNRIKFIEHNRNIDKFEKKVLCYNRRAHPHRRYLFYQLYHDETIRENTYLSLNNGDQKRLIGYEPYFGTTMELSDKINQFYEDNPNNWVFDGENLDVNLATDFNIHYHKNTFVSLVSETTTSNEIVFFSEKMFKPIYACQPFILSSSRGSLAKLKEFGFKTFDRWWDESYDNEWMFVNRVEKMKDVLRYIISKSDDELREMYSEMEEVLIHNYDLFIKTNNEHFLKVFNSIKF